MDRKSVEKLCKVLGELISVAIPIIVTAMVTDSKEDSK